MSNKTQPPDITRRSRLQKLKESSYAGLFVVCALVTLLTTIAIFTTLLADSLAFFSEVPVREFLTETNWSPNPAGNQQVFGIVPLVIGTLTVTFTAAFIALPVGTLTAVYLSEFASSRTRAILKPMLEILAGIPTVVYGYFALVYVTPALEATILPNISRLNALSASLMIGIMTIPMVSSISEDAMSAVPDDLRQASYGLGATKYQVSTGVVIPASISGIISSYILAVSRAIGETMIVVVAMGANANMPPVNDVAGIPMFNPADVLLNNGMTITVAMVNIAQGDLAGGSLPYDGMFALGLALFIVTLIMNVLSDLVAQRYREEY